MQQEIWYSCIVDEGINHFSKNTLTTNIIDEKGIERYIDKP